MELLGVVTAMIMVCEGGCGGRGGGVEARKQILAFLHLSSVKLDYTS